MCGFAGIVDLSGRQRPPTLMAVAEDMATTLEHRGPDGRGSWADPDGRVALAHRRLAVLDLTASAAQPMLTADRNHALVFNGEIYNHRELRSELRPAWAFTGTGDTEVLLGALSTWGVDKTVERVNGMFAFALWDRVNGVLVLGRDRLGEKPLAYARVNDELLFASEVRALARHPRISRELDPAALARYLAHGFVPGQQSILRDVRRLAPGSLLQVDVRAGTVAPPRRYWDLRQVARRGLAAPLQERPALARLDALLADAAALRVDADVPVGAFLSGGIDSTLVVGLLQRVSSAPIRTYTVAMDRASHDEAAHAAAIARHLGTDHTELPLATTSALAQVQAAAAAYDEPFGDPSAVAVLLLARAARGHITVALSGDGGDEVFGGYNRYVLGQQAWNGLRRVPVGLRRPLAAALLALSPAAWDRVVAVAGRWPGARPPPRNPGDKLHKLAGLLGATCGDAVYRNLATVWSAPPLRRRLAGGVASEELPAEVDGIVERMMLHDGLVTLPDDMLFKVDRATMAVGLEARVPLLDHRVVEFAWSLPPSLRVHGGRGKQALRRLAASVVPAPLLERPKMGFDPPIAAWLRGPLKGWAEELLSTPPPDGLLDLPTIRAVWDTHCRGRRNHDYELWTVLMFLAWSHAR